MVIEITFLLLFLLNKAESRRSNLNYNSSNTNHHYQTPFLALFMSPNSSKTCEHIYGFLPCTYNPAGHFFQIVIYEFLLYLGKKYICAVSDELLGIGLFGAGTFQILEALPDAIIVLTSGLSENKGTTESKVMIGMGMLAGKTVMLLTLLWGSCVVVGKCDLEDSTSIDSKDTKGLSLTGSGISTDIWTCYDARIVAASMIPFIIVFHSAFGTNPTILISLIVCSGLLLSYSIYQVLRPRIQKRRLANVKYKHVICGILGNLKTNTAGDPIMDALKTLFKEIDQDGDQLLSMSELRDLITKIQLEEIDLDLNDALHKLLSDFDSSGDAYVNEDEFIAGISKWLNRVKRSLTHGGDHGPLTTKLVDDFRLQTKKEHDLLKGQQSGEVVHSKKNRKWQFLKAAFMLLLGTTIATVFAEPLVDAVDNFSTATNVPSFFTSFVTLPIATNFTAAVSALKSISKKEQRNASLTLSEIYGAVFMNNIIGLAIILALVYTRGLPWDFIDEVLAVIIICIAMALFTSFRTTFPLWTSFVAFLLYPFFLVLVYFEVKVWWFMFLPVILGVISNFPLKLDEHRKLFRED